MVQHLISVEDLTREQIDQYLDLAMRVESLPAREKRDMLRGSVMASLFFEPSTRTRLSFESAMLKLGGQVIGFSEVDSTSLAKGESLQDTLKTIENYADVIVMRHPKEGAARLGATICNVPVVNAGDGANQHPTQTLLDLHTIRKLHSSFNGLKIALVGDLKYSRTVHSLLQALCKYENVEFTLVSPEMLRFPKYVIPESASTNKIRIRETESLESAIPDADIIYMTRIQRERFPDPLDYEKVKNVYCLNAKMLKKAKPTAKVMHPLPRVNEIAVDVDTTPHAHYFPQVLNGVTMRQAILLRHLGVMK
jgi:aspartate carbamoyltransferase catalytic subunit